jgi:hypothetical protein
MKAVYETAPSYADQGLAVHAAHDAEPEKACTFSTHFARSRKALTFEFREGPDRYLYRVENGLVSEFTCRHAPREIVAQITTLDLAMAGMIGVSLSAGYHVPRMLLPTETTGRSIVDAGEPRVIGVEVVSGESCSAIDLGAEWDLGYQVYVGDLTHTLRRVHVRSLGVTLTYEPVAVG